MDVTHACCSAPRRRWYQNKIVLVVFALSFLVGLSYVFPVLQAFRHSLFMYIHIIWWAILLGLFIGGVIDHFVPQQYVIQVLSYPGRRSIVQAVLYGFLMSACCHGILALAIQLYKKGAATSSIVAFLLASPWANLPLSIVMIGFFGVSRALYIIFSAIIIALVTGFIFQIFESRRWVESNPVKTVYDKEFSITKDIGNRYQNYRFSARRLQEDGRGIFRGAVALSNMVLWWILIGIGLASLIGSYVPEHFFHQYMGPTARGMLTTLLAATILEVCSEGTTPVAFELFRQTGALGNALVFLMAGVATDYTEIGLLWHNIGRRTAILLPLVAVPQILVFGFVANVIF